MHRLLYTLLILSGVLWLSTGCQQETEADGAYQVTVSLNNGRVHTDSATLVVVDDDYGKLRVLGGARLRDSAFTFTGHTTDACIAFVDFVTDSLPYQFYFILEPGTTAIKLTPGHWRIVSQGQSQSLFSFMYWRQRIADDRQQLWERYQQMAADSTLTWDKERAVLRRDSLLQDSLQRITVERINRGDLVSRLVKQRLLPTLTRESLERLTK